MQDIKQLREEFIELYDNNDIPAKEDIVNRPDKIANWWLSKLSLAVEQEKERIIEVVKNMEFLDKDKVHHYSLVQEKIITLINNK